MNKFVAVVAATASAAALSGCGAGGNGTIAFAGAGAGPITAQEVNSWMSQAENFSTLSTTDLTFKTPNVANATYNGIIEWEHTASQSALGRMTLNADFVGNTVSGQTGDYSIVSYNPATPNDYTFEENLTGSIPITNGTITGTTLAADMNGSLGTNAGTYSVNGVLDGEFIDVAGSGLVIGLADGTINHPTATTNTLFGAFFGFQQ